MRYVEAEWPQAEFIVGNPPFLGRKMLRDGLGERYVDELFRIYEDRVSSESDLVVYWFAKAWEHLQLRLSRRVGLVATNSIRGGPNRRTLDPISTEAKIFEAWSDEPWTIEGASVRVSLICFGEHSDQKRLNGVSVAQINSDLTSTRSDIASARQLPQNRDIAFMGGTKGGAFDVPGNIARDWLVAPKNPNDRSNSDVLKPWVNAFDIVRRRRDRWIIDFGTQLTSADAALYELPFEHINTLVRSERETNRREGYRKYWWRHMETRAGLRSAIASLSRFICTPKVSKHRVFVWLHRSEWPENLCDAIARDDDCSFGILHSRFHEAWSLRLGTSLEDRPRYTPTTTFETFPFPEGLTPNIPAKDYASDPRAVAIAKAAKRLNELRNAWLNPPDLVRIEPEVVPGYPDRILPKDAVAAAALRERTLTNLYNQRPQWLIDAHRDLAAAVAAAYGWPADISEEDALAKLLDLNLQHLVDLAHASNVPVVGVTETAPPGLSYQDWMLSELDATEKALAGASS